MATVPSTSIEVSDMESKHDRKIEVWIHPEENHSSGMSQWKPPGKNCGLCGQPNCGAFVKAVKAAQKTLLDCPFYTPTSSGHEDQIIEKEAIYPDTDVLGNPYDFVLTPLPGEISARKIVLPFRPDLVERYQIKPGDIVIGRPTGAGCPVQHVLQVVKAEMNTGLLETWVVGPRYSRSQEVIDLGSYHMIGFEGIASHIRHEPQFGFRHTFLPGFCMMSLNHTGLVNMILNKKAGPHIRIENVIILAGPKK